MIGGLADKMWVQKDASLQFWGSESDILGFFIKIYCQSLIYLRFFIKIYCFV